MPDLYSLNGAVPAPLPHRIRMPDGRTRTNQNTFTPEELAAAGYVLADAPPFHNDDTQLPPAWSGSAWTGPATKPLPAIKARKIERIKARMEDLIAAGFIYSLPGSPADPHTYQIDLQSQAHMLAVFVEHLAGVESPHGGYWRDLANVNVTMSDAENKTFLIAAKAYKMAVIRRAQTMIDVVRVAENPAGVAAVNHLTGAISGSGSWPANG